MTLNGGAPFVSKVYSRKSYHKTKPKNKGVNYTKFISLSIEPLMIHLNKRNTGRLAKTSKNLKQLMKPDLNNHKQKEITMLKKKISKLAIEMIDIHQARRNLFGKHKHLLGKKQNYIKGNPINITKTLYLKVGRQSQNQFDKIEKKETNLKKKHINLKQRLKKLQ